ncbi:MAG: sugar phosphate isomerase/epimerase [Armatimonadota bacterium]
MGKIPIALQLYSVREDAKEDLPGVLEQVAGMGYQGVEFAGFYGWEAEEIRSMLDDNGLVCCGSHQGIDTLLGDELLKTAEFNATLGNPFLICPGLPEEYRDSRDAWAKTADLFNEIAERLRPMNLWTGYHNHFHEFTEMDGELPWDTFFSNTDSDIVMQLDTGNALKGGGEITQFLERYPARALTVHVKEFSEGEGKPVVGEGDTDWDRVFELCETVGATRWYIVEQESYAYEPLECVERCLQNLREMGK